MRDNDVLFAGEVKTLFRELIDVKENNILSIDFELLDILLKDRSSGKNILWGTDNYSNHGVGFHANNYMYVEKVTGFYGELIKPRVKKTKEEQNIRIRDKAEVFTPSWICNKQNNLIDNNWFNKENVFNIEKGKEWIATKKVLFPSNRSWEDYIKSIRLEVSCGEAPYLVSRYDTVTGETIDIKNRIGLLDRKFRVLNENVDDYDEWIEWSKKAVKSVYGYDWQGDNVLLARENMLYTYIDNYRFKFNKKPSVELVKEIAEIISWNIWQMDGINYIVPYSCKNEKVKSAQLTLFGEEEVEVIECLGCKKNNIHKHNGIYAKIMNWESNRANKFINLINRSR